ncbi:conserved hypothetical protein [Ricinus communis]|uniref:Uncharacterized protein n=1 Tax=Ricinus communis TaxID=3988 RepID=B9S126_RICCO|nr:conserved hypothetical protein [Ricinus communis]
MNFQNLGFCGSSEIAIKGNSKVGLVVMAWRRAGRRNKTLRKHNRERPGFKVLDPLIIAIIPSLCHHHFSILFLSLFIAVQEERSIDGGFGLDCFMGGCGRRRENSGKGNDEKEQAKEV